MPWQAAPRSPAATWCIHSARAAPGVLWLMAVVP
jgi:hypothetical protein